MSSYRPIGDHLRTLSAKHALAVLETLHSKRRIEHPNYIDFDGARQYATDHNTNALVNLITKHYSTDEIRDAHNWMQRVYAQQSGYKKRGRRPGTTYVHNKNKSLAELDSLLESEPSPSVEATPPISSNSNGVGGISEADLHRVVAALGTSIRTYVDEQDNAVAASLTKVTHDLLTRIDSIVEHRPTVVELVRPNLPTLNLGLQHKQFPLLLRAASATLRSKQHLNIWLYGPAGTGKSTAAENLAKALGLNFYTNGALETKYELISFRDAMGIVHDTQFKSAWCDGGVYCFDEIDGSMPSALLGLNGALATGLCPFPDGLTPRHPDCIIIAGANTVGNGADSQYVGTMKMNAATRDRFVFIHWPIDEALEDALCADKDWLALVRKCRANTTKVGNLNHLVTPRAAQYGEALLATGISVKDVCEMVLRKGLSEAQWHQIRPTQ